MSSSKEQVHITINLPQWIYRPLRALKRRLLRPGSHIQEQQVVCNLAGDRHIEWSWVAANMPNGTGEALDFGCGQDSHLGLIAARRGFHVTCIDLETIRWAYVHPNLKFIQGDALELSFPSRHFDLVINCSSIEHVGLAGRYGVRDHRPDGDIEAMARLWGLIKPSGVMLLTIPVGQDAIFAPLHRVYGVNRLPKLLERYIIEQGEYWIKDNQNRWVMVDKVTALNWPPGPILYGLGCFVLRCGL